MKHPICVACGLALMLLAGCGGESAESLVGKARQAIPQQQPQAAIIHAKNALQSSAELPEARLMLGLALLETGDAPAAEVELRKAQALGLAADNIAPPLARAMLAQKKYQDVATQFADTEIGTPAARAALKISMSIARARLGQTERARVALAAALAADPDDASARLMQARYQAAEGNFDAALATVDAILARNSADHLALIFRGDVLWYGQRDADAALLSYRNAVTARPNFAQGQIALLAILFQRGDFDSATKQLQVARKAAPGDAQVVYLAALLAYAQKDFKSAREQVQHLVRAAPDSANALQLAGDIELQLKAYAQAESYLGKALQIAPESALARRLLVRTYLRMGQGAKALADLQPLLISPNEDNALLNALAGEVYRQNADPKRAEAFLYKAARQDPDNIGLRTSLALAHLALDTGPAPLLELQKIAATDPTVFTADLALITASVHRKEFDRALQAIDALDRKQPDKPLAANLRGRVLLLKKDLVGARRSLERALRLDAGYFPAIEGLAALDLQENKPDEARRRFEALLANDSKNVEALIALARLRGASGAASAEVTALIARAVAASPGNAALRLLLVEQYLRVKEVPAALAAAREAVAAMPASAAVLDALARTQLAAGDLKASVANFKKVAAMEPQSAHAYLRLAQAQVADKDLRAASASLRSALAIQSDLLDAQQKLAAIAVGEQRFDDAQEISRSIQKQRPKEAIGYLMEAEIAGAQKLWPQAARALRTGLINVPSPELAKSLYLALGADGKTKEAEKFAATWLRENPRDVIFRLYLGNVSLLSKDYAAAENMYAKVTMVAPDHALAFNNLAWVSDRLNKPEAVEFAAKAVALAPDQPEYMDTLATLLAGRKDYAQALQWQRKALALQPDNGVFRLNLARHLILDGNKSEARRELQALAQRGERFQGHDEVERLLKTL